VSQHHRDAPIADDHLPSVRAPPPHPRELRRTDVEKQQLTLAGA
jgi:hypothetical protein